MSIITVEEWLGEGNKIGIDIWKKKYRNGNETLDQWFDRVSGNNQSVKELIKNKKFLFGGRTLSNRGLNDGNYFNCFSSGFVNDDYNDIMETAKNIGLTFKAQGGQGLSLSKLRPKGVKIGKRYTSDGIIPFLEMYNTVTSITSQAGSRKGALLVSLDIRHKEAEDFIKIKTNSDKINKANLSLEIDDVFMEAVREYYQNGNTITLHEKREYSGHIVEYDIIPIKLYKLMMQCATDWGEPGCIFTNEFRNYNLMEFVDDYQIETCNPSLRKGTQVLTENGVVNIEELEGKKFRVPTLNNIYADAECFLSGRNKQLYKVTLENNQEYFCTPEHKWAIYTPNGYKKVETTELSTGDWLPYTPVDRISNGTQGNYDDGFFFGYWYGDGSLTVRSDNGAYQYNFTFGSESKSTIILDKIEKHLSQITGNEYNPKARNRGGQDWYEICSRDSKLHEYFARALIYNKEHFPSDLLTEKSEEFRKGFIDGLFSSDGSVDLSHKGEKICFSSSSATLSLELSSLLNWYGIKNTISNSKRDITIKDYEYKDYVIYHVTIARSGSQRFKQLFKLTHTEKYNKLLNITKPKRTLLKDSNIRIKDIELTNICEDVWDIHVYDETHTFRLNCCITGNCGEQPLKKNSCCNLGSINLSEFVLNEYTDKASIDFENLDKAISTAIEALDDIIDENMDLLPLETHKENAREWRNIGLGVMGFGTMLFKLGLTYGSAHTKDITDNLFYYIFRSSVIADNKLAERRGTFPKYTDAIWGSRIIKNHFNEDEINRLKINGLRNCSLLSIAPTGTLSSFFGITGGAEPEFAISYERKTDNLNESYNIYCQEAQHYMNKFNTQKIPNYFVCSSDINWKDRVDMQSIIQRHIDTAISSTVNLPLGTTVDEVEQLYLYAWEKKVKGITIFVAGCKRNAILNSNEHESKEKILNSQDIIERGTILEADDNVVGLKRKLTTGCGSLHCTAFFDPETGELMETYFNKGSTGGCNQFMIGLSRTISLLARSGVKLDDILDQLNSCGSCPSYAVRTATKHDTSKGSCCPVAIGVALKDMYTEMQDRIAKRKIHSEQKDLHIENNIMVDKCPQCGENTLVYEGGCSSCKSCGYSKCG